MRSKLLLSALLYLLGISKILSQNNSYVFNNYSNGNQIFDLAISKSKIFAGTSNGAYQRDYNGTFEYVHNSQTGLLSNTVNKIFVQDSNKIWFATPSGVELFDGSNYFAFDKTTGLLNNSIFSICSDSTGSIWVANLGGLSKYKNNSWTNYSYTDTIGFTSIINSSGLIWCTTNGYGLFSFNETNWTVYDSSNGFLSNNLIASQKDTSGKLWIATADSGLLEYNGTWIQHYDSGLKNKIINDFVIDKNNIKWILTSNGIVQYNDSVWKSTASLLNTNAKKGSIDFENNLWYVTDTNLIKYNTSADTFKIFRVEGLMSNYISAINIDTNNTRWICTGSGISLLNDGNWNNIPFSAIGSTGSNTFVSAIKNDSKNNSWISHFYPDGISCFNGTTWATFNSSNGLNAGQGITCLAIDSNDFVWAGSQSYVGVQFYNGTQWAHFSALDPTNPSIVMDIAVDKLNNKWFATDKGVVKYNGMNIIKYDTNDGLFDNYIQHIAVDSKNNIWVATYYTLAMFNGLTWKTYTVTDGLAEQYIRAIAIDKSDNVWCGHQTKGISMFNTSDTTWQTLNTSNGLVFNQVNSIAVDSQNNIFIGTPNGLSVCQTATVNLMVLPDKNKSQYANGLINIPISVSNFNKIKSVSFSLHFDENVIKFKGFKAASLYNLNINDFDTTDVQNGTLTLNYNNPDIFCQSIGDNSIIFYLTAEVINNSADSTEILIDNNPKVIALKNYTGQNLDYKVNSLKFKISDLVSIKKSIKDPKFTIYPNPTSNEVEIESTVKITHISITDLAGNNIKNTTIINEKIVRLDIQDLIQGIYLLKMETEFGMESAKLIKFY